MHNREALFTFLETPALLLDMRKLELNIKEMTDLTKEAKIKLRPHIKVHGCSEIAKMQIEAGACGIEVGNVFQAEMMAYNGINDIVIAHPCIYTGHKGEALRRLFSVQYLRIALVIDMIEQANYIADIGQSLGISIPVALKIDTAAYAGGISRFGVNPSIAVNIAKELSMIPGIAFRGIYAHEIAGDKSDNVAFKTAEIMCEIARQLRSADINLESVSVGSSPTFRYTCSYIKHGKFSEITECHSGHSIIGDIGYSLAGGNQREACALSVLVTVTSTSHDEWFTIDAGYKTFGSDYSIGHRDKQGFFWHGKPSFGSIQNHENLWPASLGAETGMVFYMDDNIKRLKIGDRLEIVPNNSTLVISLHDKIYGIRNTLLEKVFSIDGRGRGF